ncbi:MAG: 4-hydroxythreonine-4-phosphate dehydrogenase PdxA [Phycisphaerae bacterium]
MGDDGHLDALRSRPAGDKPCVAITMGDPAGIGAEVIAKALADPEIRSLGRFIIFGMEEPLDLAAGLAELDTCWYRCPHDEVMSVQSGVVLADYDEYSVGLGLRHPNSECGAASLRFVEDAIQATRDGLADVVVTGPIHKISWRLAGCKLPGHTELLSDRFKCKRVTMMFAGGPLKVALASTHVGLFELRNRFTIGLVFQPIDLLDDALRRYWGIQCPRIAVAGLNPHAGDGGRFGDEESRIIEPAIIMAREAGILVEGPFAVDTIFHSVIDGRYDGVVVMYHDQGMIPIKLLAFDTAVNITLGLPIIRTSVDHGPAFDIAGRNKANPGSMKAAIRLACTLASAPSFDIPRVPFPVEDQTAFVPRSQM